MSRILVSCNDRLGEKRAGPAIRALELVNFLATHTSHSISLLGPGEVVALPAQVVRFSPAGLRQAWTVFRQNDVIIAPAFKLSHLFLLTWMRKTVIFDAYDPVPLEILEQHRESPAKQKRFMQYFHTQVLNLALRRADVIWCASERQRAWYLGILSSLGRIQPESYALDPNLKKLLQIVPFGLPETAPQHTKQVLKGVVPGIEENDFVVLWGGGIWNWFDPETAIQAVALVAKQFPQLKLFFLGIQHPNPVVPAMKKCAQAVELSQRLGLTGKSIFFNEGWIPFNERQNYLLESDLAISIHEMHLETEFSFRTRILDYLWAGLPMVVTEGDVWSEVITQRELGYTVSPHDVERLAEILTHSLNQPAELLEIHQRVEAVANEYTWSRWLTPVAQNLESPLPRGTHLSWWKKKKLSWDLLWVAFVSLGHTRYFT